MKMFGWSIIIKKNKEKSSKEQTANRYHLNSNDFRAAEEYIDTYIQTDTAIIASLGENDIYRIKDGLIAAAIVSYGRAFSKSIGGENSANFAKIDIGKAINNDQALVRLHKLIMKRRNKAVAHSDTEFYKSELIEVRTSSGSLRKSTVVDHASGIDIEQFKKLAGTMKAYSLSCALNIDVSNITSLGYATPLDAHCVRAGANFRGLP